ncbi:MAG: PleD family two-component system response regulator, partial [Rhizobiaceae bacterium]|nr:PleD family two-component system response regulator [Rhizobiaceae bacterium]
MTARILVVDDVKANVTLLETRLLAEYFEVLKAYGGAEALETCENGKVDVVLLDVMMPEMDGFETCRRLKSDPATAHIPVVMVTALDQISDRVRGLEAGADDFLTKPVNDLQLITRVKSLVRLKSLTDELRLRASTTRNIGIEELLSRGSTVASGMSKVLLVEERQNHADRVARYLRGKAELKIISDPQVGLLEAAENAYDCVIISTALENFDPLRLCSQLRSIDRTRFVPIMLIANEEEEELVMRGLELGINDYLIRPLDEQELTARLTTQVKRKRYNDQLRASVAQTIEMAVTDGLTGLHNRRYFDSHLETLFERAEARRRPLSLMITDIDRFKAINDMHGHDGGDDVLREFTARLRQNVRGIDLACRFGGEEFIIVMPDTEFAIAQKVAERVRAQIAATPFEIGNNGKQIDVTV